MVDAEGRVIVLRVDAVHPSDPEDGDVIAVHFGERTLAVEVLDVSENAGKSEASFLYREISAQD